MSGGTRGIPVRAIPLVLLASWFSASGAAGTEQICKQRDVVDFVSETIRHQETYVRIDPNTIVEQPAPAPDTVLCLVQTVRGEFDYRRFERMKWAETREYFVRKLEHGYEVTVLR